MKFLLSAIAFLISANAFAKCPAPLQGNSDFEAAVGTFERYLGASLKHGTHAEEIATDGKPLKLDFERAGNSLKITLWRSVDGGIYNKKQISGVAEVCSTSGEVKVIIEGTEVNISKDPGGTLSISAAGYGPYKFAAISSTTKLVAKDAGASR